MPGIWRGIEARVFIIEILRYKIGMATRTQKSEVAERQVTADPEHDAFVRAKVLKGLEQSRDRASMIPIEQAWHDLTR